MQDARKHVLFVIPTLGGGGAERVVVTLLKHLDRARFRLSLAVVDMRGAVYGKEIPQDVELIDVGAKRVRHALFKLIKLVRQLRPDVVFSTLGHLNLALALIRPLLPSGVRTVARETLVVSSAIAQGRARLLWRTLYRLFYRKHDHVVCQSRDMYEDLVSNFRLPTSKATVINNPVDVEQISAMARQGPTPFMCVPGTLQLVAAGRLDYQKGFDLLIDALSILDDASVYLTILGEGPLRDQLERQVVECGVMGRVQFGGFQANPYVWFAHADAFVLASRYEGFPNVVLEALTCGTPVIAMPAPGGVREILEGVDGCVIAESLSAESLARAIRQWREGDRRRVSTEAIVRFDLGHIVRQYETVLACD
jgi:glycosyltransferase involved in cell wall biosynthesis